MDSQLRRKIKTWPTCGARQFLNGNDAALYARVKDLIGERVQVHTNRTKKIWSVHSVERAGACIAYAKDAVFLKDVRWVPPEVGAARGTYFPSSKDAGDTGRRTVQAFAEGILLYAENDASDVSKNYAVSGWEGMLAAAQKCVKVEASYRPFLREELGFFRGEDNRALDHSDYAILEWAESGGKRSGKAYAYCDPKYFSQRETDLFVEKILCPCEDWLRNRFKSESDFREYLKTEKGQLWLACTKG